MRRYIHRSAALRALIAFAFACCAFLALRTAASAADYAVTVLARDGAGIRYSVASPGGGAPVLAITATYRAGQLRETFFDAFTTGDGPHAGSVSPALDYDDFKIMLLDGETYCPLCPCGGYKTVRFFDGETVLSEQRILSGQAAQPPLTPEKDGLIFMGWGADYTAVFTDMDLTACYAPPSGDNLFRITPALVSAAPGESLTFRLRLDGTVSLCGFDLRLRYDASALEFVEMDPEFAYEVTANHVAAGGYIRMNFSSRENKTVTGDILEVTFRVRDTEAAYARLALEPISVIGVDPDDASHLQAVACTVSEGVIWIS